MDGGGGGPALPPGSGFGGDGGGPRPPPAGEVSAPFANRKALGFLRAFIDTWKLAALDPAPFFRSVRISESGSAVLFGVIAFTIGSVASMVYEFASSSARIAMIQRITEMIPSHDGTTDKMIQWVIEQSTFTPMKLIVGALVRPLIGLALIYLSAGITHVLLVLFRGAGRGFDATLTTVGYASGVYLVMVLPMCGSLIAPVWCIVCIIVGLAEAQRCGPGKAALAVITPFALVCCCACMGISSAMFAGMSLLGGGAGVPTGGGE
jgi:hypothetical protein